MNGRGDTVSMEKKEQIRKANIPMPVNGDLAEGFGQLIEMFPDCEKETPESREITKRWAEEYRSLKTSEAAQ